MVVDTLPLWGLYLAPNGDFFATAGKGLYKYSTTTSVLAPVRKEVIPPRAVLDGRMLRFTLPRAAQVEIGLYDAKGRHVRQLVNEVRPAGSHSVEVSRVPAPGLYLLELRADYARKTWRVRLD
jgi:hypothetical protein